VAAVNPFGVPVRLWERLCAAAGVPDAAIWAGISKAALRSLAAQTTACDFSVSGKSMNKEEFVTCGGVRLNQVDFATMESRICPGLFFAGEVLDIDGITGGFNFQAAWTTGWHAGRAMAETNRP
jgi:predicted Rossmann fold flavoprotein